MLEYFIYCLVLIKWFLRLEFDSIYLGHTVISINIYIMLSFKGTCIVRPTQQGLPLYLYIACLVEPNTGVASYAVSVPVAQA